MKIQLTLNGETVIDDVDPAAPLLEWIRSRGLTGTKEGCGIGVCGLCTVLVDDLPVSSCLYLTPCAEGRHIVTVEGVRDTDPGLVEAFADCEGMQCGICTPGQVMIAAAARREAIPAGVPGQGTQPTETDEALRTYLQGNLCRCTGYSTILEAVRTYLAS